MHSPTSRQVCLAAVLLVCGAWHAAGQTADPRAEARVHIGPLYATPALALQEFGVDTNVFNSADAKKDFTFTLVPRATVWVPFAHRALVTSTVGSDVVYYQTFQKERSLNPLVRARAEGFLGRVMPFVEASFVNTRQRPNFEIDARSRRTESTSRAGASVRVSPKLVVEAAASQATVAFAADAVYNDVNLQETLNRTTRGTSLAVRLERTPLTTLVLRADRDTDRFEFSPLRDANSFRLMPGVEFKPRALVSGSAFVGVRRFTPQSSTLASFDGVVANATLNYSLLSSTRLTFTADRNLTYSYERLQPYFVVDGYGASVRRQIVGRVDVIASVERQKYSYRDLLLPGSLSSDLHRIDLTHSWSTTVGYRLGQASRIGFGAFYRGRDSNSSRFRNYSGFRFATTVDYGL